LTRGDAVKYMLQVSPRKSLILHFIYFSFCSEWDSFQNKLTSTPRMVDEKNNSCKTTA